MKAGRAAPVVANERSPGASRTDRPAVRWMLFYDGTRNDPRLETNVHRLRRRVAADGGGFLQCERYWEGVGVKLWERVRGGAFGWAMSEKLREGYGWLAENHQPHDEIFIFGFSRGAFTAMGLVGLLAWRGLPRQPISDAELKRLYADYRTATLAQAQGIRTACGADQPGAKRPLEELVTAADLSPADRSVAESFRPVRVRFVGLFDTVRAAGMEVFKWGGRRLPCEVPAESQVSDPHTLALRYTRHLPSIVDRAFHALAIDEHRAVFHPRVWIVPRVRTRAPEQVEQRWFAGAHANVGGGYAGDALALIPLQWMEQKAEEAGAVFVADRESKPKERLVAEVRDSYREWLRHLYPIISWRRYHRPIHAGGLQSTGRPRGICYEPQTIDPSVFERIRSTPGYRPPNVLEFMVRWLPPEFLQPTGSRSGHAYRMNAPSRPAAPQTNANGISPDRLPIDGSWTSRPPSARMRR